MYDFVSRSEKSPHRIGQVLVFIDCLFLDDDDHPSQLSVSADHPLRTVTAFVASRGARSAIHSQAEGLEPVG